MATSAVDPSSQWIRSMLNNGTITKELVENQKVWPLLESQTLADFLGDYPTYKIGPEKTIGKASDIPGLKSLIDCIATQWTRHLLQTGKYSEEDIQTEVVSRDELSRLRDEVPEVFHYLFEEQEETFLSVDITLQQAMVSLVSNQSNLESLARHYESESPRGLQRNQQDWLMLARAKVAAAKEEQKTSGQG